MEIDKGGEDVNSTFCWIKEKWIGRQEIQRMKHTVEDDTDNAMQLVLHRLCCVDPRRTGTGLQSGRMGISRCLLCLSCYCLPANYDVTVWILTISTNKRLLDEVASVPSKRLRNKISGCTLCRPGFNHNLLTRSHHPLDEAYSEGTRPWYLFPTARRGARAKGPVRYFSVVATE